MTMKGMKTSCISWSSWFKNKICIIAPRPLFSASQKKYGNFIRLSCAVPWNDRLERALKKMGDMAGDLMDLMAGLNN